MWLTTPRFLVGLLIVAVAMAFVVWSEVSQTIGHGTARACYGIASLIVMGAIVFRTRARLNRGRAKASGR